MQRHIDELETRAADMLREWRAQRGLSQPALAERCQWEGSSRISMYERGERAIGLAELGIICRALDVSLDAFIEGPTHSPASLISKSEGCPTRDVDALEALMGKLSRVTLAQSAFVCEALQSGARGNAQHWASVISMVLNAPASGGSDEAA